MIKLKPTLIIVSSVAAAVLVGLESYHLANNYLNSHRVESTQVVDCNSPGQTHKVTIENSQVNPVHTDAKLCDNLTIINLDDRLREVAFGEHDDHQTYDNVTEEFLKKDQGFSVKLNQAGNYLFHDHLDETVKGDFTVTN